MNNPHAEAFFREAIKRGWIRPSQVPWLEVIELEHTAICPHTDASWLARMVQRLADWRLEFLIRRSAARYFALAGMYGAVGAKAARMARRHQRLLLARSPAQLARLGRAAAPTDCGS